jgi:hypothetical protein
LHFFWIALCGAIALGWIVAVIDTARGVRKIPSIAGATPLADADCPSLSILYAARDEAEKLPGALETFLALDYPRYEVVAVDDRSADATTEILAAAAKKDARLKSIRLDSLPPGWLGKPHALQRAYENSSGEWIVFTDADVHFAPELLRRAIALAQSKGWEHMTLLGRVEMRTIGERIALTFFGMSFLLGVKPWRVSNPRSGSFAGVGSFQLIRRSAYDALGTHRRLAMEVIDDMKLGKLAKQAGVRSGVATAKDAVSVDWHAGVANIVRGTTKNFFATTGFRPLLTCLQIIFVLLGCAFPFVALFFAHGWARVFDAIALGLALAMQTGVCREFGVSRLYALTQPIGAVIFAWMLARSTIVTLRRGGITWRGTFYPLEELKRGVV